MCCTESRFSQYMPASQILMNGSGKNSDHIQFLKGIFHCKYFGLRSITFILNAVIL